MRILSRKFSKPLPEHYSSIDYMPMVAWEKIHKNNMDLTHLLIKQEKLSEGNKEDLKKVWDSIYREFINQFGFSERFIEVIEQKLKIARLKYKHIITGDDTTLNFIKANEKLLIEIEKKNISSGDIYETKQAIEKFYGIRISFSDCTVREFYSYIKTMKTNV